MSARPAIPQGVLKILNIADITWDNRFRKDYGNISDLADSIKEKGVLQPITVNKNLKLLAGERRIRAAIEAGLVKIPALVRPIVDETDAREIELMENIYRYDFRWNERAALVAELDRLYKENDYDWSGRKTAQLLDRGVASVSRDLKLARSIEVIPELAEYKTADEALKVVAKMEENVIVDELRSRQTSMIEHHLGEAGPHDTGAKTNWGLAKMLEIANENYRIGDTFKGLAELRSNGLIHIIECDPPYGIDLASVKSSKDSVNSTVTSYHEIPSADYPNFLGKLAKELYRVASPNCWLVFWFGPTWQHEVLITLRAAGWEVDEIPAIWIKKQGQTLQPELYLPRAYEPFYLCRKGKPILVRRGRLNTFDYPGTPPAQKYHPTERPLGLMEDILCTLGVARQIVLIPFLGSGVTLRAAYLTGMLGFGWDSNKEYKDRFMLAVEADTRALDHDQNSPAV